MVCATRLHTTVCVDRRFSPTVNISVHLPNGKGIILSRSPFHLSLGKQASRNSTQHLQKVTAWITWILHYILRSPETNSSPLKIQPWKRLFLLETTIFRGRTVVTFREDILSYCIRTFPIPFNNRPGKAVGQLSLRPPPPSPTFAVFVYVANVSWCHASWHPGVLTIGNIYIYIIYIFIYGTYGNNKHLEPSGWINRLFCRIKILTWLKLSEANPWIVCSNHTVPRPKVLYLCRHLWEKTFCFLFLVLGFVHDLIPVELDRYQWYQWYHVPIFSHFLGCWKNGVPINFPGVVCIMSDCQT